MSRETRFLGWTVVAIAGAASLLGCGALTGVSKDYEFFDEAGPGDGGGGEGGSTDGATDGSVQDAGIDGAAEGQSCSAAAPCSGSLGCCGAKGGPLTCKQHCSSDEVRLSCQQTPQCGLQTCCIGTGSNVLLSGCGVCTAASGNTHPICDPTKDTGCSPADKCELLGDAPGVGQCVPK